MSFEGIKYFKASEFDQRGDAGSGSKMKKGFIQKLDNLRGEYGFPIRITSGYRSPEYNSKVSGTGKGGPHTTGRAADLAIDLPSDCFSLFKCALELGFTGFGVKCDADLDDRGNSRNFLHLDDLAEPEFPRPMIWSYDGLEHLRVPEERKYCFGTKAIQVIKDLMNDNPYVSIFVYQISGTDPHERFIAWQSIGVNQLFSVPRTSIA